MANVFGKSLLASIAALVVAGGTLAQDNAFQEGIKLLRLNQKEAALGKFQEYLKTNPSDEEALQLYRSVDADVWVMLLGQKGDVQEIQQIAASILERAKMQRKEMSRDQAAIDALVAQACAKDNSNAQRREARLKLIADHGEYAVPALVTKLGDADDPEGQVNAIYTLYEIGHTAVMPLLAALHHSDGNVRLNVAAALHQIGDLRAAPALAALAQLDDQENVRDVARRFLAKHQITGKAVDLYVDQARDYLRNGVRQGAFSDVVWTLQNDKLVATDVPALVYGFELAKACANAAVAIDPISAPARSLVAQSNLGEAHIITSSAAMSPDDAGLQALVPMAAEFEVAALATGTSTLRAALDEALRSGLTSVALGTIGALGKSEDRDSIAGSSLLAALDSGDKRISHGAALAIAQATGGINLPEGGKVVEQLAQAVQEESVRVIQTIGGGDNWQAAARQANDVRGNRVAVAASAERGIDSVFRNPNTDVLVINEVIENGLPEDIIGLVHKDSRLQHVKIVIVAKDVEKAKERFGDSITDVIAAPLTGETLVGAVDACLKDVPIEPRNARAEMLAQHASESLLALADGKANIGGALVSLAAQLNRADGIAIPAAKALGLSGGAAQLDALLAAVTGAGSVDLKAAAADAIGMILGRGGDSPANVVDGLKGVLHSDADIKVRMAAATALGKAHLADGDKAQLIDSLKKIGGKVEG